MKVQYIQMLKFFEKNQNKQINYQLELLQKIKIDIMKEREARKANQRKIANYIPSYYTKLLGRYLKGTAKTIDPLIRSIANQSPLAPFIPLYEFLRAAARLFLLSEIQLLLAVYKFESDGWSVEGQAIMRGSEQMGDLFWFPNERNEYRQVGLYLMLVCFWSKRALNESCGFLLDEAKRICFRFKDIFKQWLKEKDNCTSIQPKLINRLYATLSTLPLHTHYNYIVDQIVQLSHAYNPDKAETPSKQQYYFGFKRQSQTEPQFQNQPRKMVKVDVEFAPPSFFSIQNYQNEQHKEESIDVFGHNHLVESQRINGFFDMSYNSSVPFLSLCNSYKKQNSNFESIQIGVCEGQSADLMVFGPQDSIFSSGLLIKKGTSKMQNSIIGMREINLMELTQQSSIQKGFSFGWKSQIRELKKQNE